MSTNHRSTVLSSEVRENRASFLVLGVMMTFLGIEAIALPYFASLAIGMLTGAILLVIGVAQAVIVIRKPSWRGFPHWLSGGLLSAGIGLALLAYPLAGVLSLTLLLAAFLLTEGALRVLLALRLRPYDHWNWSMASGVLALMLAVLILTQWPEAALWILGLSVGIDLIFSGWMLIMLAAAARH
ncbi:MAG: DUF308 domain-containing protein [Gammaproteobacteria bacterium]|nr:DUF308 domain-containing protein [Gammaproteobacteria bacterium]